MCNIENKSFEIQEKNAVGKEEASWLVLVKSYDLLILTQLSSE